MFVNLFNYTLKNDLEEYVQDDGLRKTMDTFMTCEKNGGRIEIRRGFVTHDIDWLYGKDEWKNITSIGAIHRQFTYKDKTTDEWHYYISSRELKAESLLKHARLEWSVESMHWLLDVHFGEDYCRVEDENVQQVLNVVRKIALNCVKNPQIKIEVKTPFVQNYVWLPAGLRKADPCFVVRGKLISVVFSHLQQF